MPRKEFDGRKLVGDIALFDAADKQSPPEARPSLMDAVRKFATLIDTRSRLGWTDPMIATVLTEAGYPINAATLRSYRKRLRDEGRLGPKLEPRPQQQSEPAREPQAPVPTPPFANALHPLRSGATPPGRAEPATAEPAPADAVSHGPPTPRRHFTIQGNLPPDRA